jgi:hypothetical protein
MIYPFRIERNAQAVRSPIRTEALESQGVRAPPIQQPSPQEQQLGDYVSRLVKLIPTEIVGIYLTVRGFWQITPAAADTVEPVTQGAFVAWWPLVCILLLWISRAWGTRGSDGKWDTIQAIPIAITTASFIIWVYAVGDRIFGVQIAPPLVSTAIVVWVFVVPYFYKGEKPMADVRGASSNAN